MTIENRKKDHVHLSTREDASYRKTSGFEQWDFIHNALPEVNLKDITTQSRLFGREFSFPLFISSMTGGYPEAGSINGIVAEFCQSRNLPFGVGSQRVMLEKPEQEKTFSIVRKKAPDAFIAANIGGNQMINHSLSENHIHRMIDVIEADAVIVHLNPLQELVQPEGERDFSGIEQGIARLVKLTNLPVIVKETGAGISPGAALRLIQAGVKTIDISGAGGTSWSKVENLRVKQKDPKNSIYDLFEEWGNPTAWCLEQLQNLPDRTTCSFIASGGIRTAFDMAKAMALGADFTAVAQPLASAIRSGGIQGLEELFSTWQHQLTTILALLGCRSPADLKPTHLRKR